MGSGSAAVEIAVMGAVALSPPRLHPATPFVVGEERAGDEDDNNDGEEQLHEVVRDQGSGIRKRIADVATVLDLIYAGDSDLAWKFVDALGAKAQQNPFPSLEDFARCSSGAPIGTTCSRVSARCLLPA